MQLGPGAWKLNPKDSWSRSVNCSPVNDCKHSWNFELGVFFAFSSQVAYESFGCIQIFDFLYPIWDLTLKIFTSFQGKTKKIEKSDYVRYFSPKWLESIIHWWLTEKVTWSGGGTSSNFGRKLGICLRKYFCEGLPHCPTSWVLLSALHVENMVDTIKLCTVDLVAILFIKRY